MDDDRWYLANIIFLFLFLGEEGSRKLESSTEFLLKKNVPWCWIHGYEVVSLSFDNDCDPQRKKSDFQMVCYDCLFCLRRELIEYHPRLGMAWRLCLGGMPCTLDLYLYLSIEVVIGLIQWSPFLLSQVVL